MILTLGRRLSCRHRSRKENFNQMRAVLVVSCFSENRTSSLLLENQQVLSCSAGGKFLSSSCIEPVSCPVVFDIGVGASHSSSGTGSGLRAEGSKSAEQLIHMSSDQLSIS